MYEIFYNFSAEPFRLSPDHRFCFEHKSYGKARAYMAYAFKRAEGFVMITGRPGTGKTTLIGELVESLSVEKVVTANLVCTQLQADDLLRTVAYSFGISPSEAGKAELLQRLNTLLHRWHREGRRALLVVDEAQDLSTSAMEELRLLTNIQFGGQPLLQIFLLGQPELRDLILSPEMEQVHQRIVAASHIEGLEANETEAYVIHRLTAVGWCGDPAIDRAIFPVIHRFSEGVPRRINLICSRLFLLGSVEERHTIELEDVRVVITELQAENLAAGTGIAQQDFRTSAAPEWVPVPEDQSQEPPLPQLKAVENASCVAEEHAGDEPAEAKKKDIPSLEPLVNPLENAESDAPGTPVALFEILPDHDSAPDELAGDDAPASDLISAAGSESAVTEPQLYVAARPTSDPVASESRDAVVNTAHDTESDTESDTEYDTEYDAAYEMPASAESDSVATFQGAGARNVIASTDGTLGSPPSPQKRIVFLCLVMLAAVALVLVLKACFVTNDDRSIEDVVQRLAPPEHDRVLDDAVIATPANRLVSERVRPVGVKAERQVLAVVSPTKDIAQQRAELHPIVVDTGLRRPASDVTRQHKVPEASSQDLGEAVSEEGSVTLLLPDSDPDRAASESSAAQDWRETILISFPFDSDEIGPDSQQALDRAATMLGENTQRVASITGFTDNRGDFDYNIILSRKRASAVERYLVDAGVDRERLQVEGRGVLTGPMEGQVTDLNDPLEPFRIVQIKLTGEG